MKKMITIYILLFSLFVSQLFGESNLDLFIEAWGNEYSEQEINFIKELNGDSQNGKVKEIFFYDEKDLLVKKWSGTWNNHFDLLSFEYDIEQNIAERKVAEGYEETLYFYDTQNRLIRTTVTNSNEFCNYIMMKKEPWSLEEQKSVMGMLFMI